MTKQTEVNSSSLNLSKKQLSIYQHRQSFFSCKRIIIIIILLLLFFFVIIIYYSSNEGAFKYHLQYFKFKQNSLSPIEDAQLQINSSILHQIRNYTKDLNLSRKLQKKMIKYVQEFLQEAQSPSNEQSPLNTEKLESQMQNFGSLIVGDILREKIRVDSLQSKIKLMQRKKEQSIKIFQKDEFQLLEKISSVTQSFKSHELLKASQQQFLKKIEIYKLEKNQISSSHQINFVQKKQIQNQIFFSSKKLNEDKINRILSESIQSNQLFNIAVSSSKDGQYSLKIVLKLEKVMDLLNQILAILKNSLKQNKQKSQKIQFYEQETLNYQSKIKIVIKQLKQSQKTFFDLKKIENKIASSSNQIDVCIVMDTTGSMGSYLQQAKQHSSSVIKKFNTQYNTSSIKFAFISYKDHQDSKVVQSFDFNEAKNIEDNIKNVYADGGGDTPEAAHDGLYAVSKLNWRKQSTKFVFWIFDAPPHGKQYHSSPCCQIKLQDIIDYYKENRINLNLKECGYGTGNTRQVFQEKFPKNLLEVSTLQASNFAKDLQKNMKEKLNQIEEQIRVFVEEINIATKPIMEEMIKNIKSLIKQVEQSEKWEDFERSLNALEKEWSQFKQQFNDL